MKLKWKIITICLIICSLFTFSSCDVTTNYNVTVEDQRGIILNQLKSSYQYGEVVEIKVRFFSGPRAGIVVNKEKVYYPVSTNSNYETIYFKMPKEDILIQTIINESTSENEKFDVKQINFRYIDQLEDQKHRYEFSYYYVNGYKFDDSEYNLIIEELSYILPENSTIDGFYSGDNKVKYESFKEGFSIHDDLTLYYTSQQKQDTKPPVSNPSVSYPPAPVGVFKLTIIDSDHFIYDKPKISVFTPGTQIKFHATPITDVDLAMYIDHEFHDIQIVIEINDNYVWEYSFTMPCHDTTIEFSIQSYPYYDFTVNADYGLIAIDSSGNTLVNKVTYLLNDCIPFFDPKDYGFEFILGTKVRLWYTGELLFDYTYPSVVVLSKLNIMNITFDKPTIYEYQLQSDLNGERVLMPTTSLAFDGEYTTQKVIQEDLNFCELNDLEMGAKVYLVTSMINGVEKHVGFYSYRIE